MSKEKTSSSLGVFIILAGVAILLINLNILQISMFWGIVKLWPFLLIIAGLSIILKNVRYINIILWLGFLGFVVAYSYLNMNDKDWFLGESVELAEMTEIIKGIEQGHIDLDLNHGSIDISTLSDTLTYAVPESGVIESSFDHDPTGTSVFKIKDGKMNDFIMKLQSRKYKLVIPEDGIWSLKIDGGVLSSDLDFSNIPLNDVNIDFGVGDVNLTLHEESEGIVSIDMGIGDVDITVPDALGVKIYSNGGLVSIDVPSSYKKINDVYYSPNYDDADHKIDIKIDIGIGSFELN